MLVVALIVSTVICAWNWGIYLVGGRALILFMRQKNYTPPTDTELKTCVDEVLAEMLRIRKDQIEP